MNRFPFLSLMSVAAALLFFTDCKKQTSDKLYDEAVPVADFTFDKSEYLAGDIIHLTNNSSNASTYKWTFPDGTTTNAKDEIYYTVNTGYTQTLNFKLEAVSGSGLKRDYTIKSATVKSPTGRVTVTRGSGSVSGTGVSIYVDNNYVGVYTIPSNNTINCGDSSYPTLQLGAGNHEIKAVSGFYSAVTAVTVPIGGCVIASLQ